MFISSRTRHKSHFWHSWSIIMGAVPQTLQKHNRIHNVYSLKFSKKYLNAILLLLLLNLSNGQQTIDNIPTLIKNVPESINNHEYKLSNGSHLSVLETTHRGKRRAKDDLQITGIRVEGSSHEILFDDDGIPSVLADSEIVLRIFGFGIGNETIITFTTVANNFDGACQAPIGNFYHPLKNSSSPNTALYNLKLPKEKNTYFICAKTDSNIYQGSVLDTKPLTHQGQDIWLQIKSYELLLPIWSMILIIAICLCFSALFSGLNLGLMALDRTELKILRNTGTDTERKYAKIIQPVRDRGNFLLCSILLGNVLVNSTFTILMDSLTSGLVAVIASTLAIVIFGEITPQAICSRHGLAVGARTIYVTKAVMLITFPLSYPTSKILDAMLGEEIGNVYNRERLKELVKVTTGINDLDKNEVNIISGALELRKKTVADVMTRIDDAFMLSLDAILDFETVSEIMKSGFSRIPVYDGDRKNIVTLLYIKDLAFVDTDDNTPLKTLCEFYQNPVHFVFEDYTLDVMFNQFKDGTIGHLAFVHRVNNEGDGDPFYETIGLVTLEDVIEELIQAEIVDETDVFIDNRTKVRRNRSKKQDFSIFAERRENQTVQISPQLTLATFQYLSTAVDAYKKENISEQILRRLLNQDVMHCIKCKGKEKDDCTLYIYQQGKPADCFVLILEGRVEVTIGKENLLFESGPFTYFGTQALVPSIVVESPKGSMQSINMESKLKQSFVPDYSVRAITDVTYMAVKRSLYLTARKATLLEKSQKSGLDSPSDGYDVDVEKFLHSFDDSMPTSGGSDTKQKNSEMRHKSSPESSTSSIVNRMLQDSVKSTDIIPLKLNSTSGIIDRMDHEALKSVEGSDSGIAETHLLDKESVLSTPLLQKSYKNDNNE